MIFAQVFGTVGCVSTAILHPADQQLASAALDRYCELERAISHLQAQQTRVLAELSRYGSTVSVAAEVALAVHADERYVATKVADARALTTRLPRTLAALDRGDIDGYKAHTVAELTRTLSDDLAREADLVLDGRLLKKPANLRQAVNRVIHNLDPEGYERRSRQRRRARTVSLLHQDHTMSTLTADLPCEAASAIYASLTAAAKGLRRLDKTRTLDQLRADILTDRLLNAANGDSSIKTHVYVYVDLLTLTGLNNDAAYLPGHGPIPAWLARDLATAPNSTWSRLITDPDTGQLLSVGRTKYKPPADLDDYIRVRARTCQTPGCNNPAQFGDIDHTTDWQHRGETSEVDLRGKCRHHHKLKDEPGWTYLAGPGGTSIIKTPAGRIYTSEPEPFHEPRRPPEDPPPP
ncbi:HNH endonuclease signature motif containing protein [Amycolatopsis sp. NBC_00438]|uniref:HNH endonuclease signature motif containing protein n=1 Tax=Amycolatopsis sp. NBC_00438 TaxID=2903558 RepID=UPI002E22345C